MDGTRTTCKTCQQISESLDALLGGEEFGLQLFRQVSSTSDPLAFDVVPRGANSRHWYGLPFQPNPRK